MSSEPEAQAILRGVDDLQAARARRTPGPSPRRRIQAQVARRQLQAIKDAAERGRALPVHVVDTDDLSRRDVLVYSILGQAAVQVAVQVLRAVL